MEDFAIKISANSQYQPERSSPEEGRYVFAYTIVIENQGRRPARLLDRHWIITDADGKAQEVRGEGVVGEQPHLKPGDRFEYTSGAIIATPIGSMHGSYFCVAEDGEPFTCPIELFVLEAFSPGQPGQPMAARVLH